MVRSKKTNSSLLFFAFQLGRGICPSRFLVCYPRIKKREWLGGTFDEFRWKGDEVCLCVCCETKRNRSTSSSVRQGKEHSRSRSGRSFNFVGDKRVGTSQASAEKKGDLYFTLSRELYSPNYFLFWRDTHTQEKSSWKGRNGGRLVSPL
jgi:hypothetical protein